MTKRGLFILLAVVLTISLLSGCATTSTPTPTPKAEVTVAVNVGPEPETIDPALNAAVDGATLIVHAFEGLYILDKDGIPQLGQAKEVKVSDDKLTYTATLRDDAKWADGQAVKAGDFVYSWKRAIDLKTASPYSYMFDVIAGVADYIGGVAGKTVDDMAVKAIDDKTIEIKLASPCPYFKELLAFPTYVPLRKDKVDGKTAWATEASTYMGNGPYMLSSWAHKSEMVYVKNPNYYDVSKLGPDKIKFVLMDDDNAILAAFKNGQIMFADSLPNDEINALKSTPEYFTKGQLGTYYISFNAKKAPFNNVKVRKALSLAIDRNFIAEQIGKAGQVPASAYVPIGLAGKDPTKEFRAEGGDYYSVKAADYAANVAEAKKLLAEAGYPGGKGFPKFEYLHNVSSGHQAIGEALQNMWKKELGIECTLSAQEWGVFTATRRKGDYDVARNGWLGDYNDPISFLDMWETKSGNNDSKWSNAEFDALIKTIKGTDDRTVRYDAMHKAEDILMAEMPQAPIYYYVDIYLKSAKLEGFYSSPLGFKYFMYTSVK